MAIESFIGILLFALLLFSYRYYQYVRCENIFEKIKWIANKSDDDLVSYINNNGWELKNPTEYQLKTQEMEFAKEIICLFKKTNTKNFFCEDRTSLSQKQKEIYKLREFDYFMFCLICFLQKNFDDYEYRCYKDSCTYLL